MFQAVFVFLVAVLACKSLSVSGELGGDTPVVLEAVFVEAAGESGETLQVLLADFEGACSRLAAHRLAVTEAQTQLLAAGSDADFLAGAEAMEEADALLPENYWLGQLQFSLDDVDSDLEELSGTAAGEEAGRGFTALFSRHTGYTDWSDCSEAWLSDPSGVDVCDYRWQNWISDGGSARVLDYGAGAEVSAEFSAPFQELDVWSGDVLGPAGEIDVRFEAHWCAELEEASSR